MNISGDGRERDLRKYRASKAPCAWCPGQCSESTLIRTNTVHRHSCHCIRVSPEKSHNVTWSFIHSSLEFLGRSTSSYRPRSHLLQPLSLSDDLELVLLLYFQMLTVISFLMGHLGISANFGSDIDMSTSTSMIPSKL